MIISQLLAANKQSNSEHQVEGSFIVPNNLPSQYLNKELVSMLKFLIQIPIQQIETWNQISRLLFSLQKYTNKFKITLFTYFFMNILLQLNQYFFYVYQQLYTLLILKLLTQNIIQQLFSLKSHRFKIYFYQYKHGYFFGNQKKTFEKIQIRIKNVEFMEQYIKFYNQHLLRQFRQIKFSKQQIYKLMVAQKFILIIQVIWKFIKINQNEYQMNRDLSFKIYIFQKLIQKIKQ